MNAPVLLDWIKSVWWPCNEAASARPPHEGHDSAYAQWLQQNAVASECLRLLEASELGNQENAALEAGRNLLRRSENIVFRNRGREPGDQQAVDIYQQHVALAYYGFVEGASPVSQMVMPLAGSVWSQAQLEKLRDIGLRHGAQACAQARRAGANVEDLRSTGND